MSHCQKRLPNYHRIRFIYRFDSLSCLDLVCFRLRSFTFVKAEMKVEIQTFTDSEHSGRFILYASWYNKSIIIVKEERFTDEDCAVVNSLSVPKDLFSLLQAKGSTFTFRENLGSVGDAEIKFHARTLSDRLESPLHVRKIPLDRDSDEIPLYENKMGCFNDLETLEWF